MCHYTYYHFKVSSDKYVFNNLFYDINRLYVQKQKMLLTVSMIQL